MAKEPVGSKRDGRGTSDGESCEVSERGCGERPYTSRTGPSALRLSCKQRQKPVVEVTVGFQEVEASAGGGVGGFGVW